MVDRIARRIVKYIKAEFDAFIGTSEDPAQTANRPKGTHEVVAEVRDHLGKLLAEHHQANKQITLLQEELAALKEKVELAIDSDRDDLARAALIHQKSQERQLAGLQTRLTQIEAECLEIEKFIHDVSMQSPHEYLRDKDETDYSDSLDLQLEELDRMAAQISGEPNGKQRS